MENLEYKKYLVFPRVCVWLEGWKSGRVKIFFVWLKRIVRIKKCNLYKLTIILLLHNK